MTVSMLARIAGHLKLGCLSILIRRVASVIPSVCYLIGQGVLRGFLSHGNVDGQKRVGVFDFLVKPVGNINTPANCFNHWVDV